MTDVKMVRVDKVAIGSSSDVAENIIRFSTRLVSPDGALVEPIPVINEVQPVAFADRPRYWEMELELDGDNYELMRNTEVSGAGTKVIRSDARQDPINYFLVSGTDTAGTAVSYSYESGKVFCAHAEGHVSNEPGTVRSPSLYRFICVGSNAVGATSIAASDSDGQKFIRINKVTANGVEATNILRYDWYLVGSDGGDILYPRTTPNVYYGLTAVEPSGKHWKIVLTFDTYTSLFNANIGETTANTTLATTLEVELQMSDGNTWTHTYQASKCSVTGFIKSSVREKDIYHPGVVELICTGSRTES